MKKIISIIILGVIFFAFPAMAANTYSLDLEKDSSQYGYAGDSESLSITSDISIETWVKPESQPGTNVEARIIDKLSYLLDYYDDAGTKYIYLFYTDGVNYTTRTIASTLTAGTWYHLAMTTDVLAKDVHLYINGVDQSLTTGSNAATSIQNTDAILSIGRQSSDAVRYFDGLIDEVRIWNDVRSEAEIQANYQKELVGDEAGLAAYYKLNNSALDETANNNDLTLVNSPVYSTDVPFVGEEAAVIKDEDIIIFE